jgi:hypothetical protein
MLQRLLLCYKEQVVWRMDLKHYEASEPTVALTNDRLAKLNSIRMDELQPLKEAILTRKKAGY